MSEAKPTKGEWIVRRSGGDEWYFRDGEMTIVRAGDVYDAIAVMNACPKTEEYFNIFTQALNVREKTGLTPSQLVERVKELEELLNGVLLMDRMYSGRIVIEGWQEGVLRAALSKARPNTAEGEAAVATNLPAEIVELLECSGCLKAHMKERALATVTRILSAQHGGEL